LPKATPPNPITANMPHIKQLMRFLVAKITLIMFKIFARNAIHVFQSLAEPVEH
jgi:hypothetical protein